MQNILFEEKQYLGFNKYTLLSRLFISILCFGYYYVVTQRNQHGDIFLLLGIVVLTISAILLFVLHLHTKVDGQSLILEGFWTTRKVKIPLISIQSVEQIHYNTYFFNSPVYNLHSKGTIRFYTRGEGAVKLTDREGLVYIIGTQKPLELINILTNCLQRTA